MKSIHPQEIDQRRLLKKPTYKQLVCTTHEKGRALQCALNLVDTALTHCEDKEVRRQYLNLIGLWSTPELQESLTEVLSRIASDIENRTPEFGFDFGTAFDPKFEDNFKYVPFINAVNKFVTVAFNNGKHLEPGFEDPKIKPEAGKSSILQYGVFIQSLLRFSGTDLDELDRERREHCELTIAPTKAKGRGRKTEECTITAAELLENPKPATKPLREWRQEIVRVLNAVGVDVTRTNTNPNFTYYWYGSWVIYDSLEAFCRASQLSGLNLESHAINRNYFRLCDKVTGYPPRKHRS